MGAHPWLRRGRRFSGCFAVVSAEVYISTQVATREEAI